MSSVPVRTPTVSFEGQLVAGAVYQSSVGQFPLVHLTPHRDVTVTSGSAQEHIRQLAADQRLMFSGATAAGTAQLFDGVHGLTFEGFKLNPSYSIGPNAKGRAISLIHRMASLAALRMDIYTRVGPRLARFDNAVGGANLALRLRNLSEMLYDEFEADGATSASNDGDIDEEDEQAIHEQNNEPLQRWVKLLDASQGSTNIPGLSEKGDTALDVHFNSFLINILRGGKSDFMQVIQALSAQFNLIFQPPGEDFPDGRLAMLTHLMDEEVESRTIDVLPQGRLTPGHSRLLPFQSVVIVGAPTTRFQPGPYQRPSSLGVYGKRSGVICWPPGKADGTRTFRTSPPGYIPTEGYFLVDPSLQNYGLKGDAYQQWVQSTVTTSQQEVTQPAAELCRQYARGLFLNIALAPSSTHLTTDADLSWQVGRRYRVSGADGALFTGILMHVETSIATAGNSGNVASRLTFSHVEAAGFTLPQ